MRTDKNQTQIILDVKLAKKQGVKDVSAFVRDFALQFRCDVTHVQSLKTPECWVFTVTRPLSNGDLPQFLRVLI